jgi:hypothetical protein
MAEDFSAKYYEELVATDISRPVLVSAACSEQHSALKLRTLLVSLRDSVRSIDTSLNLQIMRDILNSHAASRRDPWSATFSLILPGIQLLVKQAKCADKDYGE